MGTKPRSLRALALAAVILLAGCGGVLGGPETPAEPTDVESPTATATATATPQPTTEPGIETFSYPNGTSATSLNYTRLAQEHAKSLNSQGYAYSEVQRGTNGSLLIVDNVTSDPSQNVSRSFHVQNFRQNDGNWSNVTTTKYRASGRTYERVNASGNLTTSQANATDSFAEYHGVSSGYSVGNGDYRDVLSVFGWEATSTTTMLGEHVVRFETTALRDNETEFTDESNATLYVTERGEILRVELYLQAVGSSSGVFATYQTEALGDVSPSEPEWVRENATETES